MSIESFIEGYKNNPDIATLIRDKRAKEVFKGNVVSVIGALATIYLEEGGSEARNLRRIGYRGITESVD